jgi:hypothetical protein
MLNETSGTTADNYETTAALDLTYTGGFTLNQPGPVTGIASVALNGSSGYLVSSASTAFFAASFTIEIWVNCDTLGGTVFAALGTGNDVSVTIDASGRVFCNVEYSISVETESVAGVISVGVWHHIVVSHDAVEKKSTVYVDGQNVTNAAPSGTGTRPSSTMTVYIGYNVTYFDGFLAAANYYGGVVNATTAAALYTLAQSATSTSNAYRFLSAQTSRWANLGTDAATLTLTSGGLNTGSKLSATYRDARI